MLRSSRRLALPDCLILALLLVGLSLLLISQGWLWRWDGLLYDAQLQRWSRPAADDVIIIAIDEASLSQFGRWPWPRRLHAQLLERLNNEHPRAIAFDIIFSEADHQDPAGDLTFANEIKKSGNVVLPILMERQHQGGPLIETLPLPMLADVAAALGHVHVELDPDGIVRSLYLREGLGEPYWPHLTLALLSLTGEMQSEFSVPESTALAGGPYVWHRAYPLLIPFAGPPGHFQQISYAQVMQGAYEKGRFRDKYILIGITAAGLGDALPTPVSGFSHAMAGVEINANILHALRQEIHIRPLATSWQLLLTAIIALLPMLIFPRFAPRTNLLVVALLQAATLALCALLLMVFQRWFPPTAALITLALSYPLWSWRRLEQAIRYLNLALDQLHAQQVELAIHQQPELVGSLDFVCQILPIEGWSLSNAEGRRLVGSLCHHARQVSGLQSGQWLRDGEFLYAPQHYEGESVQLTLCWREEREPDPEEQRILDELLRISVGETEEAAEEHGDILQKRIQQIQLATTRLQELRRFVDDSLANMADGVLVTDALGQVLLSNARAESYLGQERKCSLKGESLHRLLEELKPQGPLEWPSLLHKAVLQQEQIQCEARYENGRDLLVQITSLSEQHSTHATGLIVTFSDISQLKACERKRNELLNFLSHDLRSPLVSLLALLELARGKEASGQVHALLGRMQGYTEETLRFAEQFLQLARAESAEELPFQELDFTSVALNALEQVWGQAQAKEMRLSQQLELDEVWIRGEGSLLERALVNLLGNAIKYSEPGREVQLHLYAHAGELYCCVKDQGFGIAAEDIPRLFDRFQRLRSKDGGKARGIGLGLAFVKATALRHGGRIEVDSKEGEGSQFSLILPLHEESGFVANHTL
ncbi:MAG: CHASE2 domain-containing protein [Candidatus Polarisedimenticolaceae bacterium]|nr:CHASE2 domain-containing protein [Candidatus Polarisedimenticolaceae bacterium]